MSDTPPAAPTPPPAPMPPATPATPAAPAAPAAPADPGARRKLLTILAIAGGAVLLVIIAIVVFFSVQSAAHSPQAAVSGYLDELVIGNAEQAVLKIDGAPTSPYFDNDVYSKADNRVTRYTVTGSTEIGSTAQVTVDLTTRNGGWTDVLQLTRIGSDGPFPVWAIDGSTMPTVEMSWFAPDGVGLSVNGVELDPATIAGRTSFPVLPGVYDVTQSAASDVYAVAPQQLDIASFAQSGAPEQLDVSVTLAEDAATTANRALRNFLDACIQQKRAAPKGQCGFKVTTGGTNYTRIKWTIVVRPTAEYGAYDGTGFEVATIKKGTFKFRGENSRYIGKATIKGYEYLGYVTLNENGDASFFSGYE
ncbi:hypothetical protein BH09ACT4_BH09ACT4_08360 [soil metagenome]